jgi:hypothetical protein
MSFNLPTNEPCAIVNFPLWEIFTEAYKAQTGKPASPLLWTEAEVVQWLDLECQSPVDYSYDDATL